MRVKERSCEDERLSHSLSMEIFVGRVVEVIDMLREEYQSRESDKVTCLHFLETRLMRSGP